MKVFFAQPWGGLGDNLQFTTLPRLFSERGDEFYLSKQNFYRNYEIYEFCWKDNPYVKGIADMPPNIGSCAADNMRGITDNIVSYAEIRHGFPGVNRYPEIYYTPKFLDEYSNKTIVDLSAHTLLQSDDVNHFYNGNRLYSLIEENIPSDALFVHFSNNNVNYKFLNGEFSFEDNILEVESIFQYADIINSVKKYFCLYSGGNSMAAAIKNKSNSNVEINCFLHDSVQDHKNNSYFIFDNVNYIEVLR